MNTIDDITFKKLIHGEFAFLKEYGFRFAKINLGKVTAKKGDIRVDFIREFGTLNMYVDIRLKGQLGKKASDVAEYRTLGLGQFMRLMTKNERREYHDKVKMDLRTTDDFIERFQQLKPILIRYCDSLFCHNDLTNWKKTVDFLRNL
ncbi:MAG: hypothetical protein ISR58_15945 [Anaerolineales bacterium]|nr:hypothetical protein [Chloroflexota bacterium]MBL6982666.1 hypothetical protein [Anaerolineales bacterium]